MKTENLVEEVMVTEAELVKVLMAVTGPQPATIIATTLEKMNKKGNPWHDRVFKRQKSNIFINFNYANAVNKRLVKEGKEPNFVSKPRVWGVHVPGTPLILHKDAYYLEAGYLTKNKPKSEYFVDGVLTDKSEFEDFLIEKKKSQSQGLDEDEVVLRDFKLETIESVQINKKLYIVKR